MDPDYFRLTFGHTYWAWGRVLDQIEQISQAEYVAPRLLDHESIRSTLLHAMGAEGRYLSIWSGEPAGPRETAESAPTIAELRSAWLEQQKRVEAFLARVTPDDCAREIKQVSGRTGQELVSPVWVLMAQVLHHHTQHRAEIALHITDLGHSPGDLDITRYYREAR
jgi:uncharacterized damage-inducible protein DinB